MDRLCPNRLTITTKILKHCLGSNSTFHQNNIIESAQKNIKMLILHNKSNNNFFFKKKEG